MFDRRRADDKLAKNSRREISFRADINNRHELVRSNFTPDKKEDFELLLLGRGCFFDDVLKIKGTDGRRARPSVSLSVSENHTHLRTCVKGTHRSTLRTSVWHADAPINIGLYRVYTPTVVIRKNIVWTVFKHASYPIHRFIPCLLRKVNVGGRIQKHTQESIRN